MSALRQLQEFAAQAAAFRGDLDDRFQGGAALAAAHTAILERLAEAIATAVRSWAVLCADLDPVAPFDPTRAGIIILETVFDEVLEPGAWRVLAAAFALEAERG